MDIRFYTAQTIKNQERGTIEAENAPALEGSALPTMGMVGYHEASALAIASRQMVMDAMKRKNIFVTLDITISNLNNEFPNGKKINIASMKPDEVQHCDILHLGRISAPLRQNLVEFFRSIATTAEQKIKLANINNDASFCDYIRLYPSVVDALHQHEQFKHMNVIIFPTGEQSSTRFMISLKGAAPENISIKPIGPVKDLSFKLADKYLMQSLAQDKDLKADKVFSISP